MGRERLSLRPVRRSPQPLGLMVGLWVILGGLVWQSWNQKLPAAGQLVEVSGEVESPGTYWLQEPTVSSALAAAGEQGHDDSRRVPAGHRVVVRSGAARLSQPSDPLLVGLPVDINEAQVDALSAIPGIGEQTASAIVADRVDRGAYYEPADLLRVRGIGPSTLERIQPFITVGAIGSRPAPTALDLNRATEAELLALPGVGPTLARRIVEDRARRGPYESLDSLQRVHGIGPATVAGMAGLARASQP